MIIKRKIYTKYDDTDRLKQMKDSDILAEKRKIAPGYGQLITTTAGGAIAGGVAGSVFGGTRGLFKKGGSMLKGAGRFGKIGMALGGTAAGIMAYKARNKEAKDNKFYNDRLDYAQKQARRREKKDWKQNMTQREGYTY